MPTNPWTDEVTTAATPCCEYAIRCENAADELADEPHGPERSDAFDARERAIRAMGLAPCLTCEMCAPTPPPWLIEEVRATTRDLELVAACDDALAELSDGLLEGPNVRKVAIHLAARQRHEDRLTSEELRRERCTDSRDR